MPQQKPPLTVEQILAWADAHQARTGEWPSAGAGPVRGAPGEKWEAVDHALRNGHRGLSGGDSLSRLLDRWPPPETTWGRGAEQGAGDTSFATVAT
jgi:hypothetical protein